MQVLSFLQVFKNLTIAVFLKYAKPEDQWSCKRSPDILA